MLSHLIIKNYALIKHLEINPKKGLNVITGETGAGKSIMLGAIGLMLGQRTDTKSLLNDQEKCIIEGTFDVTDYDLRSFFEEADLEFDKECIIRREINANGKSRAFINDTPVNLEVLKKWGSSLVDVHSQHETLLLGNSIFQISIVDAFAGNKLLGEEYKIIFKDYKSTQKKLEELTSKSTEEKKQLDYNSYLLKELTDTALEEGEQELKEASLKILENAEHIKSKLDTTYTLLNGEGTDIITQLQEVRKQLDQISSLSEPYAALKERITSSIVELKDIAAELENENELVDYNPSAIEKTQERLSLIYSLQKKHHVQTEAELISIQTELEKKMSFTLGLDEEVTHLSLELERLRKSLISLGQKLSDSRKKSALPIKNDLEALLKEVGMPNASISVDIQPTEPSASGLDLVSILFSANKGIPPQELKNAASGGEFSRLMLCIKYILADKTALPTIIFDEIDTGISGEVAIKVGKMMQQMAQNHQVISISHLPQIAAKGGAHYYVYKDNSSEKTISKMKLLTKEERVMEIAQMIGGENPSETAVKSAKEMLEMS